MNSKRQLKYNEAVREAISQSMETDPSVFIIGEGVPDFAGVFGTTLGLKEKYGKDRVMDMPLSENGMTGVCIGAALTGMRPILVNQRIDFAYVGLDQIANNAAKWSYTFNGKASVPLVIRFIIGRGWGQGPQHSQNIQALFSHIPGLKVVMPATPHDAKGMLLASIKDNNPVIFIEHRWLYNMSGFVPEEMYTVPLGKAKIIREGKDISIAATSIMTAEAMKAAMVLEKSGVSVEIIDIRSLKPLDEDTIFSSVKKTGHLIVMDTGYLTGGFAGEIISRVCEKIFKFLKAPPVRITLPDLPTPTSVALTKHYYPKHQDVVKKVLRILGRSEEKIEFNDEKIPWDKPDNSFTGPF